MKHILLYTFIFISTCVAAQSITSNFVSKEYSFSGSSVSNTDPSITIFPNPTTDFINISDEEGLISTATIFNLLGKEVATIKINGTSTYDMMDHHKGVYLVQLKDQDGHIFKTVRLKKI